MKLLIISHTPHYRDNGVLKGWGPTVREIDYLAQLFEQVVHIAPIYPEQAPASALPYQSARVVVRGVKPSGGSGLRNKAGIVLNIPGYIRAMRQELRNLGKDDVVHVRCPANLSLVALLVTALWRRPRRRWFKYAGNWKPDGREAISYTLQRWWLERHLSRGVVTVNGNWPQQPAHVHSFLNPCLTDAELAEGAALVGAKPDLSTGPLRLIYVGQLNISKGILRALEIVAELRRRQVFLHFEIVGDGDERPRFEAFAKTLGIDDCVTFRGWLPRPALGEIYSQAHLMLFPTTSSEGWPKVLSEGMAYGAVPVAGQISSIPQYLQQFGTGRAIPAQALNEYVDAILWYTTHPDTWQRESQNSVLVAPQFSYQTYLARVREILELDQ